MRLIFFAIYVGIGALLHAFVIGPTFDWNSAWTIGWLLGWPIMIVLWFWAFIIAVAVIFGLCWAVYAWIDLIARARAKARDRRAS